MNSARHKISTRSEATEKIVDTRRPPVQATITQRKLYGDHWLRVLRTLPDPRYREVVRRFAYGETAKSVAMFVAAQKDLGGCQGLSFHTLRQYLQLLREKVCEADKDNREARRASIRKMAKRIQKEEIRLANVVPIDGSAEAVKNNTPISSNAVKPVVRAVSEIEKELKAICASLSAREPIVYNFIIAKLRLEAGMEVEQKLKLPLDVNTKIMRIIGQCTHELLKCDRAELVQLKSKAKKRRKEFESGS